MNFVLNGYALSNCYSPGINMNKLPIVGILVLMLLVVSGYVSSEETQTVADNAATQYLDPHLGYYEKHLVAMGIERSAFLSSAEK